MIGFSIFLNNRLLKYLYKDNLGHLWPYIFLIKDSSFMFFR